MSKMKKDLFTERKIAVMQLRQGKTMAEVAQMLNRSMVHFYGCLILATGEQTA
jgi:DNA-binding NarL/FixJ family response regulator